METPRSFRIKYEVHCRLENFFSKEIIVKKCYSELQAKVRLNDFCVKKYGKEFDFIKVISVECEKSDYNELIEKFSEILGESADLFATNLFTKKK